MLRFGSLCTLKQSNVIRITCNILGGVTKKRMLAKRGEERCYTYALQGL